MSGIISYFEDLGLEFWTEGKNVRHGWINIQCPFCDDISNHCGVSLFNLKVDCWRCGEHLLPDLLQHLDETLSKKQSYEEAKRLKQELKTLGEGGRHVTPIKGKKASSAMADAVHLPPESSTHFPGMHIEYLKNRGFKTPRSLIRKYKLQSCYTVGRYKFRIIIPIILNGQTVSFTAKDVTDDQEPPYKNASLAESLISPKRCVYNIDTVIKGGDAILVEGPIDVWKLGDGTVSILGVESTEQQILYLMEKDIHQLFILFDNDPPGRKAARMLGRIMAPIVKEVELIFLKDKNDPGALTLTEAELLKHKLGFRR